MFSTIKNYGTLRSNKVFFNGQRAKFKNSQIKSGELAFKMLCLNTKHVFNLKHTINLF